MKKILNTNKKERHPEWTLGGNPSAIENQEAQGQKMLCESSQLPRTDGFKDIKEEYERIGIKVIGPSKDDDLFYDVILPKGWKIEPAEHSMWSKLSNEKGEEVASIFYKAAFYDRSAHICFRKKEKR